MKKIFTFFVALMMTSLTFAQMHGGMRFVGDAVFSVATVTGEQKNDTLVVELGNAREGTTDKITVPDIVYTPNMVIKSFTIDGLSYTMVGTYPDMYFEWNEDNFTTTTIGTDGQEKQVTGSIQARYYHSANKFSLTAVFTYGGMQMPITYTLDEAYYVRPTEVQPIVSSQQPAANGQSKKVFKDGRLVILSKGKEYNSAGLHF